MQTTLTRAGYTSLQIALHWMIAALVVFQLVFGESMTAAIEAMEEGRSLLPTEHLMANIHYWAGMSILALVALRIIVRLSFGTPALRTPSTLMTKAAFVTHMLFYALLVAVPVTGILGYYLGDPWGELHPWGRPIFIGLIAVHAAAALFHQFWLKDGTLRRMLIPV